MNNFDILKREIVECLIRTNSKETIQVLNHLREFADGLGDDWIDIGDGGFDDGQKILITDGNEVWTDKVMFDIENGEHIFYFDSGSDPENVTHWQPLPKPPKELTND